MLSSLALAAAMAAASTPAADFGLTFTTAKPATATGIELTMRFKDPENPEGKPPAQRRVEIELPDGSRIDGTAVPACDAQDSELQARGTAACPEGSRIGGGTLELITSSPLDPFVDDVTVFNGGDQWLELFTERRSGSNTAVGHRLIPEPNLLTEELAPTPGGPPDGESVVRKIALTIDERAGYITTPPSCPDGEWVSQLRFTTADGGTHEAVAVTPCERAAAERCRVTVRLPRRAQIAGARIAVRVDGKRVRRLRGPARRVRLRLTPGAHRVVVRVRVGGRRATRRLSLDCVPR